MDQKFVVPDALFATDNHYDIPLLRKDKQARFCDLPIRGWGAIARKDRMRGTWHFYVDDQKMTNLWKHPESVLKTKAVNSVEPNFSTDDQMPLAVGLYRIYQKRWLARYWQESGLDIFVDLNVADKFTEYNMLGVPKGWQSYATSACDSRLDDLVAHANLAITHADGLPIRFLVYGGLQATADLCGENGWVHVPDARYVARCTDG